MAMVINLVQIIKRTIQCRNLSIKKTIYLFYIDFLQILKVYNITQPEKVVGLYFFADTQVLSQLVLFFIKDGSCSSSKNLQATFIALRQQSEQFMVCRICFLTVFWKDAVICRNIQSPADMVKILDTWGTAAAFQIFLKRDRVIQKLRTGCLCQMQFFSGFFQCIAENSGILD